VAAWRVVRAEPDAGAGSGNRRRNDGIAAVFSSDLGHAAETVSTAFGGSDIPVLYGWRLRECDYGQRNGMPAAEMHRRRREHLRNALHGASWPCSTRRKPCQTYEYRRAADSKS
jgi:2,3-bisphosphoglycerate-dependent phosphoglycerate mutase